MSVTNSQFSRAGGASNGSPLIVTIPKSFPPVAATAWLTNRLQD
jgi:hypothetical protein